MSVELLKAGAKHVIGIKQTAKAIEKGTAKIVFIAKDADACVIDPLIAACTGANLVYETVASMQDLGNLCDIHLGAPSIA